MLEEHLKTLDQNSFVYEELTYGTRSKGKRKSSYPSQQQQINKKQLAHNVKLAEDVLSLIKRKGGVTFTSLKLSPEDSDLKDEQTRLKNTRKAPMVTGNEKREPPKVNIAAISNRYYPTAVRVNATSSNLIVSG